MLKKSLVCVRNFHCARRESKFERYIRIMFTIYSICTYARLGKLQKITVRPITGRKTEIFPLRIYTERKMSRYSFLKNLSVIKLAECQSVRCINRVLHTFCFRKALRRPF